MQIESNFNLSTKLTVEGPLRIKEEYVEGMFESPKVNEEVIPQQLKGAFDQAANAVQQLPAPLRDFVSSGIRIPLGEFVYNIALHFFSLPLPPSLIMCVVGAGGCIHDYGDEQIGMEERK